MSSSRKKPRLGLALGGGGARGAYQAGVLSGIAEVIGTDFGSQPFSIITGVSAGAINASYLASAAGTFLDQTQSMLDMWSELVSKQVIRTDPLALGRIALSWAKDLSTGGVLGKPTSTHLLDSTPLREFMAKHIDPERIARNIRSGAIDALSVTCTSYATGTSISFFDTLEDVSWTRSARIGVKTTLKLEHILASSAIPVFFQPVRIDDNYYGDGGIRSSTPLSPAIHLGADRIITIGVRYPRKNLEALEMHQRAHMNGITLADIAGVLLNSLFLDAIEFDYERLQRINETVSLLAPEARQLSTHKLKRIPTLLFLPSEDLGALAAKQFSRFPSLMRYLLHGIGASHDKGADLLSYLAFDYEYTKQLALIGRKDALARAAEIREFVEAPFE